MNRPYLFLSGEFEVTMPIVFQREQWHHSMSASRLLFNNKLYRSFIPSEEIKGLIFFADLDDKNLQKENLELIVKYNIPCFPNPQSILNIFDRHELLQKCELFLNSHEVRQFITSGENILLPYPYVVKTGNSHRGQDKFLVSKEDEIPKWENIATVEKYYEGTSIRILIIGNKYWKYKFENDNSWIKNSAGAEVYELDTDIPENVLNNAFELTKHLGLEIAGLDYIITKENEFKFLEINCFPGLNIFEDQILFAKDFLKQKMDWVESFDIDHV